MRNVRFVLTWLFASSAWMLSADTPPAPTDGVALMRARRIESTIVLSNNIQNIGEKLPDVGLVPMTVFKDGRWYAPASSGRCTGNSTWTSFENAYLRPAVSMYYGGTLRGPLAVRVVWGEAKSAMVVGSQRMPVPPSMEESAIAASSGKLGRDKTSRRPATKDEKTEFAEQARRILSTDLKVPANELNKLTIDRLILTDLGSGKPVLVGTAVATQESTHHALFLAVEKADSGWKPILADYRHSDPKKGFLANATFVDQLDVDGDGIDELFTEGAMQSGFRAYGFRDGRWRVIYEDRRDANGCVAQVK